MTTKLVKNKFARKISSRLRLQLKRKHIDKKSAPNRKSPWSTGLRHAKSRIIKVTAPRRINIYNDKDAVKTINFINELKSSVKEASKTPDTTKVMVCFEQSYGTEAAAAVYLYAQLSRLTMRYPNVRFSIQRPKHTSKPEKIKSTLDEVLNRLGIYKLLGLSLGRLKEGPSVKCWNIFSSDKVDMEGVMEILDYTLENHDKIEDKVYRGLSEAISNAADHAYSSNIKSDADLSLQKYWFLSAVYDNELYVIVCDLGHGIPYTLGHTQTTKNKNILNKLFDIISREDSTNKHNNVSKKNHANMIHAATLVKETRTKLDYRGKGGADLRRIVNDNEGAEMTIISRKGRYSYGIKSKKASSKKERRHAIDGTVVGWSIPLTGEKQ